jgi:hypothetical protein
MYQLQLLLNIPELFTSQSKIDFYSSMFENLDLSLIPEFPSSGPGRKGYCHHAMFRSFIVMQAERFGEITDLVDYLRNNLIIAHLCGFDITKPLPSYWTFRRFINEFAHDYLTTIFKNQVNILKNMGIISGEFISMDSTIQHPKYFNGKKHRGCTKYAIISSDYRSSINRDSLYFKAVYRLRVESKVL